MAMFYDLVSKSPLFNPDMALGYSDSQIKKIAKLHYIKIDGMLYDYLLNIGRCNGGTKVTGKVGFEEHTSNLSVDVIVR